MNSETYKFKFDINIFAITFAIIAAILSIKGYHELSQIEETGFFSKIESFLSHEKDKTEIGNTKFLINLAYFLAGLAIALSILSLARKVESKSIAFGAIGFSFIAFFPWLFFQAIIVIIIIILVIMLSAG